MLEEPYVSFALLALAIILVVGGGLAQDWLVARAESRRRAKHSAG